MALPEGRGDHRRAGAFPLIRYAIITGHFPPSPFVTKQCDRCVASLNGVSTTPRGEQAPQVASANASYKAPQRESADSRDDARRFSWISAGFQLTCNRWPISHVGLGVSLTDNRESAIVVELTRARLASILQRSSRVRRIGGGTTCVDADTVGRVR